jgi:predicted nucleotidyltransferase
MSVATHGLDPIVETYIAEIRGAFEHEGGVTVAAAYPIGSAASGDFDLERSDLDLVVVVAPPAAAVVEAVDRLACPVRALDLVAYVEGEQPPNFALNVNVDSSGAVEKPDEPSFWFVVDAALAQERAVSFGDQEPWSAHFEPVSEERLREALVQAIAWAEAQPPDNEFARLNAIRSRHYLETGEWMTKTAAAS